MKKCLILFLLLAANVARADTFNLAWDAVTTDSTGAPIVSLDGYKLYVSTSPIKVNWPVQGVVPSTTTQTTATVTQTVIGKYYAVVTAFNAGGESPPSNEVTFEVKLKAPAVPNGLKLAN